MTHTTLSEETPQAVTPLPLTIPELSLVVLVGATSSGKSTFAQANFLPSQILSSDQCRALVCDDPCNQSASKQAFELLHHMLSVRLKNGRTTVIDATNVQRQARQKLVALARQYHALPVAIVLDAPEEICQERNLTREDRRLPRRVITSHVRALQRSVRHLKKEGFRYVHHLRSLDDIARAECVIEPFWTNKRTEHGPFDIIGDVHGCFAELVELLERLGYEVRARDPQDIEVGYDVTHLTEPARKVIFLGDLVDRGPRTPEVLSLVMSMVEQGRAFCVCGNHDAKLARALDGKNVKTNHGLQESLDQLAERSEDFVARVRSFTHGLLSHYLLDHGNLCVAHAGLREDLQGRASGKVRSFALYGETHGRGMDENGLPIRGDWASHYRGEAAVVYGHTPVAEPGWSNNTLCLDTGCVFGGKLSALRWPEREVVHVDAHRVWCEDEHTIARLQQRDTPTATHTMLAIEDVLGRQTHTTRLAGRILTTEEHNAAVFETLGRFGVDPRWLVYLPPTMSPCSTSTIEGYLEHPTEAMEDYAAMGQQKIVAQLKHMGSRAIAVVLREPEVAQRRFGFSSPQPGVIMTRTGRRFFSTDARKEEALLEVIREAITRAGLWEELDTDWLCLDGELMPWNAKAQELLTRQYAPVAVAARRGLSSVVRALEGAFEARGESVEGLDTLLQTQRERLNHASRLSDVYRPYCWPVQELQDYKFAFFHVLAGEQRVYLDEETPHTRHMAWIARMSEADRTGIVRATPHREVDLEDATSRQALVSWWEELTGAGAGYEGLVLKPLTPIAYRPDEASNRRMIQPAIKCRGKEYLRLIYGPEYDLPGNLERHRKRSLKRKQQLALKEFALGHEALESFVKREALRTTHRHAFAVLAMDVTPLDPRL